MKMLNIGIIGPGRVAERHAYALKEISTAQLWSVGSHSIDSATEFALKYNARAERNAYDNLSNMLNDSQLDAVIITTPDKLHTEHILLAANAGKSILVEKPLCTSIEEGQQILEVCRKANLLAAVAYHLRWHRGLRTLAQKAHDHEFGEIHHLRLHWAVDFNGQSKWRTDPKYSRWVCLTILGTHLIDIVRWIMVPVCGEVIELKSTISNRKPNNQIDETAMMIFRFESGATAEVFCSIAFDSPLKIEIYASDKNVVGEDLAGDHKNRRITIANEPLNVEYTNPYVAQLEDFVKSIWDKKGPEVSLKEALKNVEHLVAIK